MLIALCVATSVPRFVDAADHAAAMSLQDYRLLKHDVPYVAEFCSSTTRLEYVGVSHSRSLDDAGIRLVIERIESMQPTQLLIEGPIPPSIDDPVSAAQRFGEAGAAAFYARQRGIPVASLDMPFESEAQAVRKEFGDGETIAFYGLRLVVQEARRDPGASRSEILERRVLPFLAKNRVVEVDLTTDHFMDMARDATGLADPLEADPTWFNPLSSAGPPKFIAIQQRIIALRDVHMATVAAGAGRQPGTTVAVAGFSHVVMQEPAIASLLACDEKVTAGTSETLKSPSMHQCGGTCHDAR